LLLLLWGRRRRWSAPLFLWWWRGSPFLRWRWRRRLRGDRSHNIRLRWRRASRRTARSAAFTAFFATLLTLRRRGCRRRGRAWCRRRWRRRRRTHGRRLRLLNGWRLTLLSGRWCCSRRWRRRRRLLLLLSRRQRRRATLRCPRRMRAQPARFVLVKRLRCRDRRARLYHRGRALNRDCAQASCTASAARSRTRASGPRRSAAALLGGAQFLTSDRHRASHTLRRCKDARLHAIRRHRRPTHTRDKGGRDPGIDCQPPPADAKGAIDDARLSQNDRAAVDRHVVGAQAWGRDETRWHKDPVGGLDLVGVDQFVRGKRGPAGVVVAIAPVDPGRSPFIARHPEPAECTLECPTAIVKGDPAPIGFDIVGNPVPAPFIRINPVPVLIRTPVRRHAPGHPDLAKSRMRAPLAVLFERDLGVLRNLRHCRRESASGD